MSGARIMLIETHLTGDFDVEYKITEKIRFKVFNRYNNPYTGDRVHYTQGIGIFFKQDFNKFSDLLKKKEKSEMKKEEELSYPRIRVNNIFTLLLTQNNRPYGFSVF